MALSSFEEFEAQLQNTLNHFYNPLFHPEEQVFELLEIQPSQGMEAIRQVLRMHIEGMKPDVAVPPEALSRRFFEVLNYRYLASLSQEEVAFQLGMTPRNLRRIQQQAVYALAQHIWNARQAGEQLDRQQTGTTSATIPEHLPILRELEVLQLNSPGAVSDLAEILERVQAISRAVVNNQKINLEIIKPEIPLTVSVHPSVLDQILLSTIEQLGIQSDEGIIRIKASLQGKLAEIEIISIQNMTDLPYMTAPSVIEMLKLASGTQSIEQEKQQVKISFKFPAVSNIPILLIDDNPDFFHLFRRYTLRTRFTLYNIREGSHLRQALAEFHPQIIILDVLLPDVDGWQLLIDLQNPLLEQPIPIVVCTALGQKDLAYSLGAKAFLPKPVSREEFLRTLNEIV
jgi:CheY-like chemotaxis protein